jgi:hypothetical protein
MALRVRFLFYIIIIGLFSICIGTLSASSSQRNAFDRQPKAMKIKLTSDMRRIRRMLQPLSSLLSSRKLYREYYYHLKTLWTCCPLQRDFLFDRGDVHGTLLALYDCCELIKHNQSQLSSECTVNLKLFNPVTRNIPRCDGGLLRNIAGKYSFVIQLYNYTKNYCLDGLHPSLIFFNISQIIRCERAIRKALISNPQAYNIYNTLSTNLLNIYCGKFKTRITTNWRGPCFRTDKNCGQLIPTAFFLYYFIYFSSFYDLLFFFV